MDLSIQCKSSKLVEENIFWTQGLGKFLDITSMISKTKINEVDLIVIKNMCST